MNQNLFQILKVSEGRYLSPEEENLFKDYYEQLPSRLKYYQELQKAEDKVIQSTLSQFSELEELLASDTGLKGQRDMAYLYRAAALAMVQDDIAKLAEQSAFIFDILSELKVSESNLEQVYTALRQNLATQISPDALSASQPYFQALSPTRLRLYKEVNIKMTSICKDLLRKVYEIQPQLKELEQDEHMLKDFSSLLSACLTSMLAQDDSDIRKRVEWLYAYFKTLRFDMETVYETYRALPDILTHHVSTDAQNALAPYIKELVK